MTSEVRPGGTAGAYSAVDAERWVAEPAKTPGRTPYERDRARVLHSAALRRLAAKTQVHGPGTNDFVRNRLTHSLEVAQIGRELGHTLGCDPDLVDAACLAHDLGHPPFGHNGEQALAAAAASCGGFEGNAQTLRVLTRLEAKRFDTTGRSVGLNLTRATLDAATKYPWRRGAHDTPKFGAYDDDLDVFRWFRTGSAEGARCIEAQVMDLADDIAYSVHDLEDGVQLAAFDLARLSSASEKQAVVEHTHALYAPAAGAAELLEAFTRVQGLPYWATRYDASRASLAALKDMTSGLIGRFARSVEGATRAKHGPNALVRYQAELVVPRETALEIAVLKGAAARYFIYTEERVAARGRERELLTELLTLVEAGAPETLAPALLGDWARAADDAARRRVVVDHVASLTDTTAVTERERLAGR